MSNPKLTHSRLHTAVARPESSNNLSKGHKILEGFYQIALKFNIVGLLTAAIKRVGALMVVTVLLDGQLIRLHPEGRGQNTLNEIRVKVLWRKMGPQTASPSD